MDTYLKYVLFGFFVSVSFDLFSQTGPGGVGNSSSNLLWLEADEITGLVDDDAISSWPDGSGNSNNLSQGTAAFQPQYKTSIINGLPVVRFFQSNGRLRRTGFASPTIAVTAIYVNANSDANDGVLSYATSANNNDFLLFNSSNIRIFRGASTTSGVSSNDGSFHIVNAGWRSSDGSTELWKDGTQSYTTTFQTGASITSGGSFAIAGEQDAVDGGYDPTQDHLGDFAEVILYNTYLNTAQHIIVSNYLAAKYNLTIANDRYSYQNTHPNDVAGIGREDASNTHTIAASDNILRIENPSGLDVDQEYLMWGHDDGDVTTSWTISEAPDGGVNIERLAREWRLDETGDVGTVDFVLDVNTFPALPPGNTMYALMVDSDGDFSDGASVYELVFSSGTEYQVTGVDVSDGDFVAIAAVNPTLEHETSSSSGFESNNATVNILVNFIPQNDLDVDYSTADGTASAAQPDYTPVAGGTATILAGNQTGSYTITINNDVATEPTETFTITLSNPPVGVNLGTNTVHTYSIDDDDNARKIYFDASTSSGLESVTSVNIAVSINNVDLTNPTTVDYAVIGGNATGGGVDYTLASGTLTIIAGATTNDIVVSINDESLFEGDETIIIELSNPTNCNLDGTAPFGGTGFLTHTYTINNDDGLPEIEFDVTSSSGAENSTPASIQVNLSSTIGLDATVNYVVTGTATGSGTDYTLADGTLTIVAGSSSNTIDASITNDLQEELNETIIITLSGPVNATLGANTVHTYTILDDDIFGFVGPGGVGFSANNVLWVKSTDLAVVSDGTDITSWQDASGNSHDLTQGNTTLTPRYYNSVVNSLPVVRFEQANSRITLGGFANFPTTAITTFFVNANTDSGEGILSYAVSSSDNEYLLFNSSNVNIYRGGSNIGSGTAINSGAFGIYANTWQSSDGNTRFYSNGTQTFSGTLAAGDPIDAGGNFAVAGEQDAVDGGYSTGQAHQGDFGEIILYNEVLNSARRKIVENYLSAKFNITVAVDLFAYDAPGNYEHEVAGIGQDDINNFHVDAQGSGIVRVNTPSSMDNGDYLLWGHDDAVLSINTSDVPSGIHNRLNRIYRVDETNDIGTVTVQFDVSAFTIGNSSDLVLLIDTDDGSFVNASQVALSSFVSDIATFNNVDFADGHWFTLGSANMSTILPIELSSFTAEQVDDQMELRWETLSETNNDFFTLERSQDAVSWLEIGTVEGAGNSSSALTYVYFDRSPATGEVYYYRLKQTDYDGEFSYSDIIIVRANPLPFQLLKYYPNPFTNKLIIEGAALSPLGLEMYDLAGNNVTDDILIVSHTKNKIILDVSKLSAGRYIVKTSEDSEIVIKL